jgi:hypothetical protein
MIQLAFLHKDFMHHISFDMPIPLKVFLKGPIHVLYTFDQITANGGKGNALLAIREFGRKSLMRLWKT